MNTNSVKDPIVEQLHTWIDQADQQLAADKHPQRVLEDLLEELERLAERLQTHEEVTTSEPGQQR